ncbi:hypothetical protein A8F94_09180 [Bacillus sp. FJAT-27225]|uniref:hypothetical protein n=1 Tax=Bacillus sp. FJAT-27225 TaxID=1743144 RepID=UPI00080C2A7F|nr:hypothetical protein [Bacillus sp. FJAT-27225]OCA87990.1 hypothetical protein A8F94_09180 [Bacillus sp. FJAT-27225]
MKPFKTPLYKTIVFILIGIGILLMPLSDLDGLRSNLSGFAALMIMGLFFLSIGLYLFRNRINGQGFFWDDEGVVVDYNGNKVFWDEIEDIQMRRSGDGYRSTVIYAHYSHHEKIRLRHGQKLPTPDHAIQWTWISQPKKFHSELLKAWKTKLEQIE